MTENKHGEMDISTNNAILESEKEWQPAAFSATHWVRRNMCGSISSSHQRSFVHPLSCNPHCSLQHYQMKEIPTAFDKRVVILNVWFIKLYAFLEDYCVEKPHILTCYQSYFFKNILTCCGVKESRCDECLERRRTEANSSFLHELNLKDTDLSWLPVNTMKNW